MSPKKLYILVAAGGIGLASAGAWWWQNRPASPPTEAGAPAAGNPANRAGPGGPGAGAGGPGAGRPMGTPGVEVAQVKAVRVQDDAQAVGTLRSRQSVTLRPEVSGRIAEIGFTEGGRVRKGQLLVQLDDTLQRAELSQAQAQLAIARTTLQRNQELVAQNFVARRVLDENQASVQVAEAQVALAQARLQRMRITAPFDGTVGLRNINLGDYVKDGADLVNLEDTSSLIVDFRLPERYLSRIAVGQSVQVQLDALPGRTWSARVQALDPLLDANGRSVAVRAVLPPPAGKDLRPGLFARVLTVFSVNEAALVVPEEALVPQAGKQFVFKLDKEAPAPAEASEAAKPAAPGGDAPRLVSRRTEVQIGTRQGGLVQITSGLKEGDTVVVAGQQRLQRDGTAVRVVDINKPGGGPRPGQGGPGGQGAGQGGAQGSGQGAPAGTGQKPAVVQPSETSR